MKKLSFVFGTLALMFFCNTQSLLASNLDDDDDDKKTINTVFTTFMQAEKVAERLDMMLIASEAPVTNGVFLFMLQSKAKEALKLQLFDDQSEPVGNNMFKVLEGKNYNGLDVTALNDGVYTVKFQSNEGKELSTVLTVQHGVVVSK
jgi:hypothetical protein